MCEVCEVCEVCKEKDRTSPYAGRKKLGPGQETCAAHEDVPANQEGREQSEECPDQEEA